MSSKKLIIYEYDTLFNILNEIKENCNFEIVKADKKNFDNLKKLKSPNSYATSLFILQSCPWCMAQIGKFEISRNTNFIAGIKKNNDTVLLAELFFIKYINIVNAPNDTKNI